MIERQPRKMFKQTVPDTDCGDWKSSVANDDSQVRLTINDENEPERKRWRASDNLSYCKGFAFATVLLSFKAAYWCRIAHALSPQL